MTSKTMYFYIMPTPSREIFFHVGLGKTASKFLQHKIFPKLKEIYYVKPTQYKRVGHIIDGTNGCKVLVSREFDNQLEEETTKFAALYPEARIIIVLRQHDSWMASQYRRYIKNGHSCTFEEFIDVDNDRGYWRRDKVFFMPKLKHLEKLFGRKPLVLFHEDLAAYPVHFIGQIIQFTGARCDVEKMPLKPHHTSYSDHQLKVMRRVAKYLLPQRDSMYSRHRLISWLQKRSRLLVCYVILFVARLLPAAWFSREELIPVSSLVKVRNYYADDWELCRAYAGKG